MIEFNGLINGSAEARFEKRTKEFEVKIILCSMVVFLPTVYLLSRQLGLIKFFYFYCIMCVIVPMLTLFPYGTNKKNTYMPRKIVIDDENIICTTKTGIESKFISDVKLVRNFDEFYEIVFPMGKISTKYICQKNLLSKGTLEEFEELFAEKLVQGK